MRHLAALPWVCALVLTLAPAAPANAASVGCYVNSGTRNGSDSASASGFPGTDNPNGVDGSYGPSSSRHDVNEYEWCDPSDDWIRDVYMRWSTTADQKLAAERTTRCLLLEQLVVDNRSYNYTGARSSNLPYSGVYVADAFEQASQGYEEVSFIISDPGLISAGVDYYGYLQWEQEAKAGPLNNNPLMQYSISQAEYTNKSLFSQGYDPIGRWSKKIADNS